jgi:putative hydroxymethylpyrimidine transport system permease protein
MLPPLVTGQAIPVFALAPLLVLWFGYGMGSKIAMAMIIIYFPVTAALFDGLRRTESGWLDLAETMGASPLRVLWHLRLPAALPAFASQPHSHRSPPSSANGSAQVPGSAI